jgi:DNA-binding transcriptional regulator GbsR (MarR family)
MSASDLFIEVLGQVSQENGDARIFGRIVGLLVVDGGEMSLTQISERLQVSRASVSTNARQLTQRGILQRLTHPGDRQDYYRLTEMPYFDMLGELATRFRRYADALEGCVAGMRAEQEGSAERAAEIQTFFGKSAQILDDWANSLREIGPTNRDAK